MRNTLITAFILIVQIVAPKEIFAQLNDPLQDKIVIVVHMQKNNNKEDTSSVKIPVEIEKINQIVISTDTSMVLYAKAMHKILNLTLKKIYVEESIIDLDNRIEVVNNNIFIDHGGNIFSSKELLQFIDNKNIKQIVIVGRVAEDCITKSCIEGKKLGYDIFIVPEAIMGKSDEKSKTKAINKLKAKGIKVLSGV